MRNNRQKTRARHKETRRRLGAGEIDESDPAVQLLGRKQAADRRSGLDQRKKRNELLERAKSGEISQSNSTVQTATQQRANINRRGKEVYQKRKRARQEWEEMLGSDVGENDEYRAGE